MTKEAMCRIFADNLLGMLKRHRMTQMELAKRLDVGNATVHNWVTGRNIPRTGLLNELTVIFDCKVSDLIGDVKTPTAADERLAKMNDIFAMLSEEQQERELVYLQSLLNAKDR